MSEPKKTDKQITKPQKINLSKISKRKTIAVCICTAIVLICAAGLITLAGAANSNKIFDGVYIGDIDAGSMTFDRARSAVKQKADGKAYNLCFVCDDVEFEVPSDRIALKTDINKTVTDAFEYGKDGNVFKRIKNILKLKHSRVTIKPDITYDEESLISAISDAISDKLSDTAQYSVSEGDGCLIVNNGTSGRSIDVKKLEREIKKSFKDFIPSEKIKIVIKTVNPEPIDADKFYAEYNRDVKDASYIQKDGKYEFEKEINGIKLNYDETKRIIEQNRKNNADYTIPAQITKAAVTVESLEKKLISHTIASYSTNYASSDRNRAHNIELAASKINGTVLNPGERFSYNTVVGPRTAAAGFKNAHVYEGNKIVDGMGGGICQVSSTLFNTVLYADLKIVKRTNHSMPVGYVPLGRDATVSYGLVDFVFENDKTYPVKIAASCANRTLTVSAVGVTDMDYKIELYTETVATSAYPTREVENAALKSGQTTVMQNGSNGATVNTYKIYKRNGVQYDKKFVAKSVYNPIEKIVAVSKKQAQATAPVIAPAVEPPKAEQPPQEVQPPKPPETPKAEQTQPNTNITDAAGEVPPEPPKAEQNTNHENITDKPQQADENNKSEDIQNDN